MSSNDKLEELYKQVSSNFGGTGIQYLLAVYDKHVPQSALTIDNIIRALLGAKIQTDIVEKEQFESFLRGFKCVYAASKIAHDFVIGSDVQESTKNDSVAISPSNSEYEIDIGNIILDAIGSDIRFVLDGKTKKSGMYFTQYNNNKYPVICNDSPYVVGYNSTCQYLPEKMYNIVHPEVIPAFVVFVKYFLSESRNFFSSLASLFDFVKSNHEFFSPTSKDNEKNSSVVSEHKLAAKSPKENLQEKYKIPDLKELLTLKTDDYEFKASDEIIQKLFDILNSDSPLIKLIIGNIKFINKGAGCQSSAVTNLYKLVIEFIYGISISNPKEYYSFDGLLDGIKNTKTTNYNHAFNNLRDLINSVNTFNSNSQQSNVSQSLNGEAKPIKIFEGEVIKTKTSYDDLMSQLPENYKQRLYSLYAEYLKTMPHSKTASSKYETLCECINRVSYVSKLTKTVILKELTSKINETKPVQITSLVGAGSVVNGESVLCQSGKYDMHLNLKDFVKYCVKYEKNPIDGSKLKIVEL